MKKFGLVAISFLACLVANAQQDVVLEIKAGKHSRSHTPVRVSLMQPLNVKNSFELLNTKTGKTVQAQLLDSLTLIFIPDDTISAGSSNFYVLKPSRRSRTKSAITINTQKDGILIQVSKKPLLLYHTAIAQPPPDSPGYYGRSGFIHPLYSPSGNVLTDDFPAGHAHQHGIFMTWVNTTFRKSFVDFWNQHLQKGTVEHVKVLKVIQGPVFGQVETRISHRSLEHGEIIQEVWTITVYPFDDYFMFDLESDQQNTITDTLFLNRYHYGGLAFRGSRQWNPDDKKYFRSKWNILTSEGIRDSMANQTHARWVDASGDLGGTTSGATVFNHPDNFRYPQMIRVHPTMPYWCYAPVADGAFNLPPKTHFKSRFRYLIHDGPPHADLIDKVEDDWAEPPTVSIHRH